MPNSEGKIFFFYLNIFSFYKYYFQIADELIYIYFAAEMMIKMVRNISFYMAILTFSFQIALGVFGKGCYLQETWNKLDCFIVVSG